MRGEESSYFPLHLPDLLLISSPSSSRRTSSIRSHSDRLLLRLSLDRAGRGKSTIFWSKKGHYGVTACYYGVTTCYYSVTTGVTNCHYSTCYYWSLVL